MRGLCGPGADRSGSQEPHRQRDQVFAEGPFACGVDLLHAKDGLCYGPGQRHRHPAGGCAARL